MTTPHSLTRGAVREAVGAGFRCSPSAALFGRPPESLVHRLSANDATSWDPTSDPGQPPNARLALTR